MLGQRFCRETEAELCCPHDTVWVPGSEHSCCIIRADGGTQGEPFLLSLTLFFSCGPLYHGDLPSPPLVSRVWT